MTGGCGGHPHLEESRKGIGESGSGEAGEVNDITNQVKSGCLMHLIDGHHHLGRRGGEVAVLGC